MNEDILFKVQAFVDGQLEPEEQEAIAALIARDPDVSALVRELKHTRQALAGSEEPMPMPMPETRDFYWSKIQREIARSETVEEPRLTLSPGRVFLRWLIPATCVGALMVAGFFLFTRQHDVDGAFTWQAASEGVHALTYRDHEEGVTLMWFSYSGEDAVAVSREAGTIN